MQEMLEKDRKGLSSTKENLLQMKRIELFT